MSGPGNDATDPLEDFAQASKRIEIQGGRVALGYKMIVSHYDIVGEELARLNDIYFEVLSSPNMTKSTHKACRAAIKVNQQQIAVMLKIKNALAKTGGSK